ncbi:MAG: DUF979 domain-containing protein [Rhodospirillaceae bacterium]|nr:DUF979 domain-containing protein [Rhodospirillaceae bacterium]
MITLEHVYVLAGLFFGALAYFSARDATNAKRWGNTLFWGLAAVSFLFGSYLSDFVNGLLVIAIVVIGGFGFLGRGAPPTTDAPTRKRFAEMRGNRLFLPALVIPAVALLGGLVLKDATIMGEPIFQPRQATLISLALGALIATTWALVWFRAPLTAPLQEARRIMDTVGWAALLPQMLASLGAVFAASGVGQVIGTYAGQVIPADNAFAAVVAFCLGMALFTILMGNAFAAFPVMAAAIGLPLIVGQYGGDPAAMGAVGMLAGFCGTLMTPMAANFNIVPAALLQLPDRDAVIKAQIPTALPLLVINIIILYVLAF